MSMETLRRMQQSYAEEDRMIDARESKRAKDRKVVLSVEATKEAGEALYAKVVAAIKKQMATKPKASVSCKFRENCVFDYVVTKLQSKGWKAKHTYNDGYNAYDFIDAMPPDALKLLDD